MPDDSPEKRKTEDGGGKRRTPNVERRMEEQTTEDGRQTPDFLWAGCPHPARAEGENVFDDEEDILLEVEPSWWHYFWYLVFGWLLIPLAIALWKQASLTLRVYHDRVVLETGVMRKRVVDLVITEINTVEINQTFCQRLCRIGDIKMATSGVEGYELVARGLPNPKRINEIVAAQRRKLMKV